MTVRFSCPECGKSLKADPADAGRHAVCSRCGTKVAIPADPAAAAEAEEEAILPIAPRHPHEDLIDMTAMVDIVFFLLIFFLFTSLQAVLAVMDLPSPQATTGTAAASRSVADFDVTVRIDEDQSIWVDDAQIFTDQDLRVKLRSVADEVGHPPTVLVRGNADATTEPAVRVFDACAYAKVKSIAFVVQEGDTDQ